MCNNLKEAFDKMAIRKASKLIWFIVFVLICSNVFCLYLFNKYDWNVVEPWTFILLVPGLATISLIFLAIFGKNFTPDNLRKMVMQRTIENTYKLNRFDENQIPEMITRLQNKKSELNEIDLKLLTDIN